MAPSFWGPEFPPQPAAVFDDLAPVEAEGAYEDEMEGEGEGEEEGEGGEQHEHGRDVEVVPTGTDDLLVLRFPAPLTDADDLLVLRFPGAVHIFMSVSPDKVSQVEAALSLQGRLDPADPATVPPAVHNMLTMFFRGQEHKFDSVTPDEVQDILLSLGGSELMIPSIQLSMFFPEESHVFHSVSADKVQAVLSLLGGIELTVSTAVPWALHNQLTEPLLCCIFVLDHVFPDKVQAVLSLLKGGELNPGTGGGASSIPYSLYLQSINRAW